MPTAFFSAPLTLSVTVVSLFRGAFLTVVSLAVVVGPPVPAAFGFVTLFFLVTRPVAVALGLAAVRFFFLAPPPPLPLAGAVEGTTGNWRGRELPVAWRVTAIFGEVRAGGEGGGEAVLVGDRRWTGAK